MKTSNIKTANKYVHNINNMIFFVFIFTTINREFKPLGIDLRFILLGLIGIGFIVNVFANQKIVLNKFHFMVTAFYGLFFIISLLKRPNIEFLDKSSQVSLIILHFTNYIVFMYLSMFLQFSYKRLVKYITISIYVLLISFIISYFNYDFGLPFSNIKGVIAGKEIRNFIGLNFRTPGYAQDPNYATFSLVISILFIFFSNMKKIKKILIISPLFISILFTASTTVTLGALGTIIIVYISNKIVSIGDDINVKKIFLRRFLFWVFLLLAIFTPVIIIVTGLDKVLLSNYSTVWQRYEMWKSGVELFFKSPLIGSGIGAARSYYGLFSRVVQIHSTGLQLLAEGGIFITLLFSLIMINIVSAYDKKVSYFGILFVIFSMSYEILQLQFFALLLITYYFLEYQRTSSDQYEFVFVNNFSGGGAEKVANNLAIKSAELNKVVVFSESALDSAYSNVESIKLSKKNPIGNILKVNNTSRFLGKNQITLITSHLFYSHLILSLSELAFSGIYVFHSTIKSYSDFKVMRILYKIVYFNKKTTFLNAEIMNDFTKMFKVKKYIILKNFIDSEDIIQQSEELMEREFDRPYIIFVGRLEKVKRCILALQIFNEVQKEKAIDFVILGEGSEISMLKEKVKSLKLSNKVHFLGFVENPYKYIKNADLLLLTSQFESDSLVLLESLVLSTPVVSVDCDYGPRYILTKNLKKYLIKDTDISVAKDVVIEAIGDYPKEFPQVFIDRDFNNYHKSIKEFYYE